MSEGAVGRNEVWLGGRKLGDASAGERGGGKGRLVLRSVVFVVLSYL